MDHVKLGALIRQQRREMGLTQLELAQMLCVSDKAVSKWERGMGCPDVELLPRLAQIFRVELEKLMAGELEPQDAVGGNMKKLKFYVCPVCGNLLFATAEAAIACCGRRLDALEAKKAEPEQKLTVEAIENDYFVTSSHEMTKEHYIRFVALLTGDTLLVRKQYPEWDLQVRIPRIGHGMLVWACSKHGLFYQLI